MWYTALIVIAGIVGCAGIYWFLRDRKVPLKRIVQKEDPLNVGKFIQEEINILDEKGNPKEVHQKRLFERVMVWIVIFLTVYLYVLYGEIKPFLMLNDRLGLALFVIVFLTLLPFVCLLGFFVGLRLVKIDSIKMLVIYIKPIIPSGIREDAIRDLIASFKIEKINFNRKDILAMLEILSKKTSSFIGFYEMFKNTEDTTNTSFYQVNRNARIMLNREYVEWRLNSPLSSQNLIGKFDYEGVKTDVYFIYAFDVIERKQNVSGLTKVTQHILNYDEMGDLSAIDMLRKTKLEQRLASIIQSLTLVRYKNMIIFQDIQNSSISTNIELMAKERMSKKEVQNTLLELVVTDQVEAKEILESQLKEELREDIVQQTIDNPIYFVEGEGLTQKKKKVVTDSEVQEIAE